MVSKDLERLELTTISPEMTKDEIYQNLLVALKRQGIKVVPDSPSPESQAKSR